MSDDFDEDICMRDLIIRGLDDDICISLGGNVTFIAAIMEIGHCESPLVYKVEMTGEELLKFLDGLNYGLDNKPNLEDRIIKENRYIVTAYDD